MGQRHCEGTVMEKEIEKIIDNIINKSKDEELVRSLIIGDTIKGEAL